MEVTYTRISREGKQTMKNLLNYKSLINVVIITILTGSIALLLSAQTYAQGQSSPNVPNPLPGSGLTIGGPGIVDFANDVASGGPSIDIFANATGESHDFCVTLRNEGDVEMKINIDTVGTFVEPGATKVLCAPLPSFKTITIDTDSPGQGLAQWRVDQFED